MSARPPRFTRTLLRVWVVVLGLMVSLAGLAQSTSLSGIVRDDEGAAVGSATMTASRLSDSTIVAFAITNSTGEYSLALPAGFDSVHVRVAHLRYAAQEEMLSAGTARRDWVLAKADIVLPEATVSRAAVERRGDTLSFDVNRLREVRDQSIEDLLRRIPGITVATNGAISYQDLPISKFYIEGLDLLEGQYALATRNLAIDAIRDIEVIERHQPIRALDSLVRPPNAAINLRLKSKVAFTAKLEAGGGLTPGLYEASATAFGFAKAQHFSAVASANNVGHDQGEQFENLYRFELPRLPLVSATQPLPPFLAPRTNYRDNAERAVGLNYLRKLGEHTQLKAHAALIVDELQVQGRNLLTLRGLDTAVVFDERIRSSTTNTRARGGMVYEVNRPRLYLRADSRVDARAATLVADNSLNGVPFAERFRDPELLAETQLSTIIRRGAAAYRIDGSVRYRRHDYLLDLAPLRLSAPGVPKLHLLRALQDARVTTLDGEVYSGFAYRKNAFRAQAQAGLRYRATELESDLSSVAEASEKPLSLGDDFRNDNQTRSIGPYVDAELRHEKGAAQWTLTLPVEASRFAYDGRDGRADFDQALLIVRPKIAYRRDLGASRWLNVDYGFERDFDRDQALYADYILVRNRQLNRRLPTVNRWAQHALSLRLVDSRPGRTMRHEGYVSASARTEGQLAATSFDRGGEASVWLVSRNTRYRISGQYTASFTSARRWQGKAIGDYVLSLLPTRINDRRAEVTTQVATLRPELSYAFATASAVVLRPRLTAYVNSLAEEVVWQSDSGAEVFHRLPGAGGAVRGSLNYNLTRTGGRTVRNALGNASYERSFGRTASKWQAAVHVDNVFGAREYVTFSQRIYAEELAYFRLRRRQLRVVVRKSF